MGQAQSATRRNVEFAATPLRFVQGVRPQEEALQCGDKNVTRLRVSQVARGIGNMPQQQRGETQVYGMMDALFGGKTGITNGKHRLHPEANSMSKRNEESLKFRRAGHVQEESRVLAAARAPPSLRPTGLIVSCTLSNGVWKTIHAAAVPPAHSTTLPVAPTSHRNQPKKFRLPPFNLLPSLFASSPFVPPNPHHSSHASCC